MDKIELIVCIKQVPLVSELPWDPKTKTLRREMAEGMMDPAAKHALEAALQIRKVMEEKAVAGKKKIRITVITMGPPMSEEVLREALAMGADSGVLLTDPRMAGADTLITSKILGAAIKKVRPDFDLVFCGSAASDSETGQVGPQLAEELDVPAAAYVERLDIENGHIRIQRLCDNFLETLEMDLPALVTIPPRTFFPRHVPLGGLQQSFEGGDVRTLLAADIALSPDLYAAKASPTKIVNVFSPTAEKENIRLRGAAKKVVEELFRRFEDRIGGAAGKDLKISDLKIPE